MAGEVKKGFKIAGKGLKAYGLLTYLIGRNKVPESVLEHLKNYVNNFESFTIGSYTLSFHYIFDKGIRRLDMSERERKFLFDKFDDIEHEYYELKASFPQLASGRKKKDFDLFTKRFNELIESTSKCIRDFIGLLYEKKASLEFIFDAQPPEGNQIIGADFITQKEVYNNFLVDYKKFLDNTSCYHTDVIDNYKLNNNLLLPSIFCVYVYKRK